LASFFPRENVRINIDEIGLGYTHLVTLTRTRPNFLQKPRRRILNEKRQFFRQFFARIFFKNQISEPVECWKVRTNDTQFPQW
jgi:hypothetical protein